MKKNRSHDSLSSNETRAKKSHRNFLKIKRLSLSKFKLFLFIFSTYPTLSIFFCKLCRRTRPNKKICTMNVSMSTNRSHKRVRVCASNTCCYTHSCRVYISEWRTVSSLLCFDGSDDGKSPTKKKSRDYKSGDSLQRTGLLERTHFGVIGL